MKVYVINGFENRKEWIRNQLMSLGGVKLKEIVWIHPPKGKAIQQSNRYSHLLPCRDWVDPSTNRLMRWGQIACQSGHLEAWKRISEGEEPSALIVEDDLQVFGSLRSLPFRGDLTYFSGKQIGPEHPLQGELKRAGYLYWTCGYQLGKKAAQKLLTAHVSTEMIPTDEFLPYHGGENPKVNASFHSQKPSLGLSCWRMDRWAAEPSFQWKSETEGTESCFSLETFLFATEMEKCLTISREYFRKGYSPKILGLGEPNWDTSGKGGIQKLYWLRNLLDVTKEDPLKIYLALDGYDTWPMVKAEDLFHRFEESRSRVVIGGERGFWPANPSMQTLYDQHAKGNRSPFKYPNSGFLMGFQRDLKEMVREPESEGEIDDQAYYQKAFLTYHGKTSRTHLDRQGYLVLNLNRVKVGRYQGRAYCPETNCCPAIIHANGPSKLESVRGMPWREPTLARNAFEWIEVADGILAMPFLDEKTCLDLCAKAERFDYLWKPLPGDNVPGDELRLRELDWALNRWFTNVLNKNLPPIVTARWRPAEWRQPSDLFFIRYSKEKQPSLRLHEDISYFSGSFKLRDTCCGGELSFPRQNYTDRLLPLGWLVFWPSRITHPHQVLPVEKGKRISLVLWTKAKD